MDRGEESIGEIERKRGWKEVCWMVSLTEGRSREEINKKKGERDGRQI